MYGYTMDKDGKFELFDYPASLGMTPFCMHQGAYFRGSY